MERGDREKEKNKNTFVRAPERKGVTINHLNNLYFVFAFIVQFIWNGEQKWHHLSEHFNATFVRNLRHENNKYN